MEMFAELRFNNVVGDEVDENVGAVVGDEVGENVGAVVGDEVGGDKLTN